MQTDWDGRIRVPGGHVRREVAISETMIPTLAKELLSVKPNHHDIHVRQGVAIREAILIH